MGLQSSSSIFGTKKEMMLEFCELEDRANLNKACFLESSRQKDSSNHKVDVETRF